jgi:gluconokinase
MRLPVPVPDVTAVSPTSPGTPGAGGPIVVMGVSGSGKSTVGVALAARLAVPFADADDLHPAANIAKMSAGQPLTDEDRWPWLDIVGGWLAEHPGGGVMSCSALRRSYRDRLRDWCPGVRFVHLDGAAELIAARQAARAGHFMPPSLQASQQRALESLEPDEDGVRVDVRATVEALVTDVQTLLTDPHHATPTHQHDTGDTA